MADSDLVSAIQNALERKQHIDRIMQSLVNAGYPKDAVMEAARQAQFNLKQAEIPMSVPSPAELQAPAPTAPLPTTSIPALTTAGMYKPLPTLNTQPPQMQKTPKKSKIFFIFLIILNIIALGVVTYLIIQFI